MSVSNWALCPNCKKIAYEKEVALKAKVANAYGKVPADEYLRMREESAVTLPIEKTLREDWDLGIQIDGSFDCNYHGQCEVCRLDYKFAYELAEVPMPVRSLPKRKR